MKIFFYKINDKIIHTDLVNSDFLGVKNSDFQWFILQKNVFLNLFFFLNEKISLEKLLFLRFK